MNSYKCVFYNENNKREVQRVILETEQDVIKYATKNNYRIASIEKELNLLRESNITYKELRILCNEMGILLESGCEITKLFEMVRLNSNKKVSKVLDQISNYIQKGNSISEAFQKTNKFSKFFTSMIKAGEISGNLDIVMTRLSQYYDKEYKLKSKIKSMLIYPVFLIILAMISSLFIFISIIPNFQTIFINNGLNPPVFTKILINLSIFIRSYFAYILVLNILLICFIFYKIKTSNKVKEYIEKIQLKIPIIKNITKLLITTKFSRAFYILNKSGIEIIESIEISSQVVDNHILYNEILNCKENIRRGSTIGESLSLVQIFPDLFLKMIGIGEESGSLDKTLSMLSKFYEEELENKIDQGMKIIEPIIIVTVSIVIGAVIIAMLLPMFDAITAI